MRIKSLTRLFSITVLVIFCPSIIPADGQCQEDDKTLLLQLKNNLNFNSSISTKLVQWNHSRDCCHWHGVACDKSGRVISLDLSSESISSGINQSSNLFGLQFLESLNLADNSFNSTEIPTELGSLTNLTYLNLSNAGFAGQIPFGLSHLTRLVTLDLSTPHFLVTLPLQLQNPNLPALLQNLRGLTELYLDSVNISAPGREWCHAISSLLPNLQVLSLSNCYLSGPIDSSLQNLHSLSVLDLSLNNLSGPAPEFLANFSNLTALSLRSSNFYGPFSENIFQVPTLQTLNLAGNELLNGSLPKFYPNGSLKILVLAFTNFSGRLPDSIGYLRNLSRLDLYNCNFSGPIPKSMAKLNQLVYLDMSRNMFNDSIPSLQMLKNLSYIDLSHNSLTGPVPSPHFQGLANLVCINLAHNSFNGSIPLSLFSLPSMRIILLSNNQFSGQVARFPNESLSPPLETLDLSSNKLEGPIPTSFFDLPSLRVLSLSFNNFNGTIQPERFQRLQNLTTLDLSYNSWSINTADNSFSLSSLPQIRILRLASCKLQKFPSLMNHIRIHELDLSDNQISGEIPRWIWNIGRGEEPGLMYLNLSCNLLVDLQRPYTVPTSMIVLDLHSNQLRGEIPILPEMGVYVDYSSNNFSSSIPIEIGNNLIQAYFFSLSNNSLTGAIPRSICDASCLQVLDLSDNGLSGSIPQCLIENCSETLGVLNLGKNNLTGNMSGTFPNNCTLRTLDFSGNHLEGQVPMSLANCKMLEVLDLGNNRINDTFPCFLKNSSNLSVLVLRSNKFQGDISCQEGNDNSSWPKLQIIDLALNNFSGVLPQKSLLSWKATVGAEQLHLSHLRFVFLSLSDLSYQDKVTVTSKGLEIGLVKILNIFTYIDFSSNSFQGEIPDTLGVLKSLYVLNLSHNALTGQIPSSLGNLTQLGSLDLSRNKLSGNIPVQLASLTFLSFLNLSYNQLTGMIPTGPQFQTFSETSFEGNEGLCGFPLNNTCQNAPVPVVSTFPSHGHLDFEAEMFISAPVGFVVGLGSFLWSLALCKRWNRWYNKHVDELLERIFHLEERQRRQNCRQQAHKDRIRRG